MRKMLRVYKCQDMKSKVRVDIKTRKLKSNIFYFV